MVVAALAVALVAVLATRPNFEAVQARSPLLGKPAPEVVASDLDGRPLRLSALRGRFLLVNFFASWCVPCQHEHPELTAFNQRHQASGDAAVLGVVFEDDPAAVRRFVAERAVDWPMVVDPKGKVALDFGVRGPPESFLIDPNGIVLVKFVGEVRAAQLDALVREAEQARA
jgi:cytochrome c biogenesis protein CcmG/thiol:disulfide interchange protein DsbE